VIDANVLDEMIDDIFQMRIELAVADGDLARHEDGNAGILIPPVSPEYSPQARKYAAIAREARRSLLDYLQGLDDLSLYCIAGLYYLARISHMAMGFFASPGTFTL